ncbi:hypothetical protein F8M41_002552 [Gigaspora margarita]|uniref:Uncharacterized protein n=1 Tax=Gigaspora margarita TaxID=4874 RepID=A0A8H4AYP6_GIGMA|nr:hypothetical protein F8M41_002552 [Gigaspora margarita]
MILKETINIKSFFLINQYFYSNTKPYLKYYKKYYEYEDKYEEYKYNETQIFDLFEEVEDNDTLNEFLKEISKLIEDMNNEIYYILKKK